MTGIEREIKLSIGKAFRMPALDAEGLEIVSGAVDVMHATYWDSADLRLARAGVGLRHRRFDDSAEGVWTFKGESTRSGHAVVRDETEIAGDPETIPTELRDRLQKIVGGAALKAVARISTERQHRSVRRDGAEVADFVEDSATVRDASGAVAETFSELEIEMRGDSDPAIVDPLVERLVAAGATLDPTPKYFRALRALGFSPPEVMR